MTNIAFSGGKVVMRAGQIGTEQACCCGGDVSACCVITASISLEVGPYLYWDPGNPMNKSCPAALDIPGYARQPQAPPPPWVPVVGECAITGAVSLVRLDKYKKCIAAGDCNVGSQAYQDEVAFVSGLVPAPYTGGYWNTVVSFEIEIGSCDDCNPLP